MRTKILLLIVITVIALSPAKAQLINQFKAETGVYDYLQFPTEKERKSTVTIKLIEENMIGNMADKVIKNDVIAGALTGSGGVFADDVEEVKLKLIPDVFITDGDLLAEVNYSLEFKSKKTAWLPEETYNYIENGEKIQALVSYKVYTMPEKKLIYSKDKMWVNGMMAKSTSSTSGISTTSGAAKTSATRNMVEGWAKNKLDMQYGMGVRHKTLTAYMIKKQDRDDKKIAEEVQEKFVKSINALRKDRNTKEYNTQVDECIAHFNKMLKKHKAGTKKQKEALVTDNNVWCLHYNLAVANLLKGNEKLAKSHIEKASKYRVIKTKEFTNKKGEKVGEVSGMIPSGYYEISELTNLIDAYFSGIKKMPKKFVAFLNSEEDMRNASNTAREWGANIMLSSMFGFETPVAFKPESINNNPKSFSGSVSEGNKTVNFTFKKVFLIDMFGYALKANSSDNNMKVKFKYYSGSYRPQGSLYRNTYSLYLGDEKYVTLASGAYYNDAKCASDKTKLNAGSSNAKGNKNPFCGSKFQYDYNGDILITNVINKDKGIFYGWVCTDPAEYLGVVETKVRIKHTDFKQVTNLAIEDTKIERERSMKFFEAYLQKMVSKSELIPAQEISNKTKTNKVKLSKKTVNKDDNGNDVEEKFAKSELKRIYVY